MAEGRGTTSSGITSIIYSVDAISSDIACLSSGRIIKTVNGGTNWSLQTAPGYWCFYSVKAVDKNIVRLFERIYF